MFSYPLGDIPRTLSWIKDLKAKQAKEQCIAWGISRAETLEEMRSQHRNVIYGKTIYGAVLKN